MGLDTVPQERVSLHSIPFDAEESTEESLVHDTDDTNVMVRIVRHRTPPPVPPPQPPQLSARRTVPEPFSRKRREEFFEEASTTTRR